MEEPFVGRAIARKTYLSYADKYDIPTSKRNGGEKTMKELAKEIHRYEMKHFSELSTGLYINNYFKELIKN